MSLALWLSLVAASIFSYDDATTNAAPAEIVLPASVQAATTNAPVVRLPTWKEIEAAPEYAKLTPTQRKHVFDGWLQQEAASGDPIARHTLILQQKAQGGDAVAQLNLGIDYCTGSDIFGTEVLKDSAAGTKWIQKSADQGNAKAEDILGTSYQNGEDVPQDYNLAAYWFQKSAEQGNASAQYSLGEMYYNGDGIEKDQVEGVKWYLKSAQQGESSAELNLGIAYYLGNGVIKDEVEGYAWSLCAAAQGKSGLRDTIEKYLERSLQLEGQKRAEEIQAQIASHKTFSNNDSTAALPPVPSRNTPKASGSGAFISADGLVLTAAHVVQGASRIEVVTARVRLTRRW